MYRIVSLVHAAFIFSDAGIKVVIAALVEVRLFRTWHIYLICLAAWPRTHSP